MPPSAVSASPSVNFASSRIVTVHVIPSSEVSTSVARPYPILKSASVTVRVLWISAVCLFGPVIDSNRTFANIAREMTQELKTMHFVSGTDCVLAQTLPLSERAAIEWHSGVTLTASEAASCRFIISHVSAKRQAKNPTKAPGFVVLKSFRPAGPVLIEKQF